MCGALIYFTRASPFEVSHLIEKFTHKGRTLWFKRQALSSKMLGAATIDLLLPNGVLIRGPTAQGQLNTFHPRRTKECLV